MKGYMDVDHFHVITWHNEHVTFTHSFIMSKRMQGQALGNYEMKCQKVYTPHRLAKYLRRVPDNRFVVAAGDIKSKGRAAMLTDESINEQNNSDTDKDTYTKKNKKTVRGYKYHFVKKKS